MRACACTRCLFVGCVGRVVVECCCWPGALPLVSIRKPKFESYARSLGVVGLWSLTKEGLIKAIAKKQGWPFRPQVKRPRHT